MSVPGGTDAACTAERRGQHTVWGAPPISATASRSRVGCCGVSRLAEQPPCAGCAWPQCCSLAASPTPHRHLGIQDGWQSPPRWRDGRVQQSSRAALHLIQVNNIGKRHRNSVRRASGIHAGYLAEPDRSSANARWQGVGEPGHLIKPSRRSAGALVDPGARNRPRPAESTGPCDRWQDFPRIVPTRAFRN